jgi:hypothetical protein
VRVHTTVLNKNCQYKSLLISEETTSDELLNLLLQCYNLVEPVEIYSLYEVCADQEYQRKLHGDDKPLQTQIKRNQKGENCHFLVRRNPILSASNRLLIDFTEKPSFINSSRHSLAAPITINTHNDIDIVHCFRDLSLTKDAAKLSSNLNYISSSNKINIHCNNNNNNEDDDPKITNNYDTKKRCRSCSLTLHNDSNKMTLIETKKSRCTDCKRNKPSLKDFSLMCKKSTYNYKSVYNIREIRTYSNSFSSLGKDQKIFDIESQYNKEGKNSEMRVGNFVYI